MTELKIEYLPIDSIKPYAGNAKEHPPGQIEQIKKSIQDYGFRDPVGIWQGEIVEGHGRIIAAKELGLTEVPVIKLDDMTDEQRREYALVHNQTTLNSGFDFSVLDAEIEGLPEFDAGFYGFEVIDAGSEWFEARERNDTSREEGNEEYNEFLDKFEAKKTTDDCYTPDNIYDAVADWVAKEYGVERRCFVRPFYPGGDYQGQKYKKTDIVVDNPPFSILAEIVDFYVSNGIRFFLFAPGLSAMGYVNRDKVCAVCTYASVTYENGAKVPTSFVTNLGDGSVIAVSCPNLYEAIETANDENEKAMRVHIPKYEYPVEVLTAAKFGWLAKYGQRVVIQRDEAAFIRQLDAMKESGKGIYGCALLLSERAAAERAAAERAAAERAAAERVNAQVWELSEREKEIVRSLGKTDIMRKQ